MLKKEKNKSLPQSQQKRIAEISGLIKNWRINDNLTRADFGKLAMTHPNCIFNLENQRVDLITLFKCIDATGLTLSEFFEGIR